MNLRTATFFLLLAAALRGSVSYAQEAAPMPAPSGPWHTLSLNGIAGGIDPGWGLSAEFEHFPMQQDWVSIELGLGYQHAVYDETSGFTALSRHRTFNLGFVATGVRFHPVRKTHRFDPTIGLQVIGGVMKINIDTRFPGVSEPSMFETIVSPYVAPQLELGLNYRPRSGFVIGCFVSGGPALGGDFGYTSSGGVQTTTTPFALQAGIRAGLGF